MVNQNRVSFADQGTWVSLFREYAFPILKEMVDEGKLNSFGYKSMGERVPEVITTVWNLWNTGLIAIDASKQLEFEWTTYSRVRMK